MECYTQSEHSKLHPSRRSSKAQSIGRSTLYVPHFPLPPFHFLSPFPYSLLTNPKVDAVPVFTWSAVEVSLGIMAAGILELGPLMRKYNVKGFEAYAVHERLDDDTEPLKLQNIVTKDGQMI